MKGFNLKKGTNYLSPHHGEALEPEIDISPPASHHSALCAEAVKVFLIGSKTGKSSICKPIWNVTMTEE